MEEVFKVFWTSAIIRILRLFLFYNRGNKRREGSVCQGEKKAVANCIKTVRPKKVRRVKKRWSYPCGARQGLSCKLHALGEACLFFERDIKHYPARPYRPANGRVPGSSESSRMLLLVMRTTTFQRLFLSFESFDACKVPEPTFCQDLVVKLEVTGVEYEQLTCS